MSPAHLHAHRAVVWAVGEGAAYWHPDMAPETVAIVLRELAYASLSDIATTRLIRAANGQPDLTDEQIVNRTLSLIRVNRHLFTPPLDPVEIVTVNRILLRMIGMATRLHGPDAAIAVGSYATCFTQLLALPIHYDRLARSTNP